MDPEKETEGKGNGEKEKEKEKISDNSYRFCDQFYYRHIT
jgi:hypothetical protein